MQVEFHFDFGSPNAYLAHRVIPEIEARTRARFRYVPVLLGGVFKATGNRSPAEAYAGIPLKLAYEGKETRRFVAKHGITDSLIRLSVGLEAYADLQADLEQVFAAI